MQLSRHILIIASILLLIMTPIKTSALTNQVLHNTHGRLMKHLVTSAGSAILNHPYRTTSVIILLAAATYVCFNLLKPKAIAYMHRAQLKTAQNILGNHAMPSDLQGHILKFLIDEEALIPFTLQTTLSGHTSNVVSLAWSPDGERLATRSTDDTTKIWDIPTQQCLLTINDYSTGAPNSISWSPNGEYIIIESHGDEHSSKILNARTGACVRTLDGHTNWVASVAWSHNGRFIATGSHDNTAKIWNAATGECLKTLHGHQGIVTAVAWSPDDTQLVTGSHDGTAKIWGITSGQCVKTLMGGALDGTSSSVNAVDWNKDGLYIATASIDRSAKIWNATTGKCLETLLEHLGGLTTIAWGPDNKHLATGACQSYYTSSFDDSSTALKNAAVKIRMMNGPSVIYTHTLEENNEIIYAVSWSPDGKKLAIGSNNHAVKIWDCSRERQEQTLLENLSPNETIRQRQIELLYYLTQQLHDPQHKSSLYLTEEYHQAFAALKQAMRQRIIKYLKDNRIKLYHVVEPH